MRVPAQTHLSKQAPRRACSSKIFCHSSSLSQKFNIQTLSKSDAPSTIFLEHQEPPVAHITAFGGRFGKKVLTKYIVLSCSQHACSASCQTRLQLACRSTSYCAYSSSDCEHNLLPQRSNPAGNEGPPVICTSWAFQNILGLLSQRRCHLQWLADRHSHDLRQTR